MYQLRKIPMVRVGLSFLSGIACGIYLPGLSILVYPLLSLAFLGFLSLHLFKSKLSYSNNWHLGLCYHALLFSLGIYYLQLARVDGSLIAQIDTKSERLYYAVLSEAPKNKANSLQLKVELKAYGSNNQAVGALLYLRKKNAQPVQYRIGDELLLKTTLTYPDAPQNPLQFDYRQYLSYKGIYFTSFIQQKDIVAHIPSKSFSVFQMAWNCRKKIVAQLEGAGLSNDELAIAAALVIGEEDHLNPQLRSAYSASGAMHVLSVSGLHVGIIYLMLQYLFKLFEQRIKQKWILPLTALLLLWVYAFITGLSPSVQRATMMFSMVALGKIVGIRTSIYNVLAASALLLVLIKPYIITEVGFQLSYLALLGILLLQPPIYKLIVPKNWLLNKAWEITAVSIAAQLTTSVLSILYFHQFPSYFLVSNLVVIPISFVILIAGVVFLLFSWIPFLNAVLAKLLYWSIYLLNEGLFMVEKWPNAVIDNIYIDKLDAWLWYLVLLGFCLFVLAKRSYGFYLAALALACFLVLSITYVVHRQDNGVYLYHVPRTTAIAYVKNSEALLITDHPDPSALDFYIGNHSAKINVNKVLKRNELKEYKSLQIKQLPDSNVVLVSDKGNVLWCTHPPNPEFYRGLCFKVLLVEFPINRNSVLPNICAENYLAGAGLSKRQVAQWNKYLKLQQDFFSI